MMPGLTTHLGQELNVGTVSSQIPEGVGPDGQVDGVSRVPACWPTLTVAVAPHTLPASACRSRVCIGTATASTTTSTTAATTTAATTTTTCTATCTQAASCEPAVFAQ